MIVTVDLPDVVHRKLERDKRRTGLSKSMQIRKILVQHFQDQGSETKKSAAA